MTDLSNMHSIKSYLARKKAIGCSLICFRADGCMAEDHKFLWIGIIKGFRTQPKGDPILLADVEVIKQLGFPDDIRDRYFLEQTVIAANISLLKGNTYIVFK